MATVLTQLVQYVLLLGSMLVACVGAEATSDALEAFAREPKASALVAVIEAGHQGDSQAQRMLAAVYLYGVGVTVDRQRAMSWFCQLAHQPQGGREVMEGVWLLAEWFRTGGGLPSGHYRNADPDREDPLRAYFWYGVLATQAAYYEQTDRNSALLGRLGRNSMVRMLLPPERRQLDAALKQWQPDGSDLTLTDCLMIPENQQDEAR